MVRFLNLSALKWNSKMIKIDIDEARNLAKSGCSACNGKGYVEIRPPHGETYLDYCRKSQCSFFKIKRLKAKHAA